MEFGPYIRMIRGIRQRHNAAFSIRKVAGRIGVEPTYLSKVERGTVAPPSEATIRKLALELDTDTDVLLAMGGKVSTDLLQIVRARPQLTARLLRALEDAPELTLRALVEQAEGEPRP